MVFTQQALESNDILCIQEHWLFKYEIDKLSTLLKGKDFAARSIDEYDPLPPTNRPRPQGGVATLWSSELSPYIKALDEGNERILPILIDKPGLDLCLINCYLPSGNSTSAIGEFNNDVAILTEIINKYSPSYKIMITGDLNADLFNR